MCFKIFINLLIFQDCLKDIDTSLDVLENYNINEKEINKSQLIVKLIKRKVVCLMALKQYKKAQTYWKDVLQFSKNDPKYLEGTNSVANIL